MLPPHLFWGSTCWLSDNGGSGKLHRHTVRGGLNQKHHSTHF
uniref:Uncharacterized protein n=1 Tax=Anguilla anguilla TaxID=7936 RepID=A0A0E9TC10_ANGAN